MVILSYKFSGSIVKINLARYAENTLDTMEAQI
jgi:hypothetical protein